MNTKEILIKLRETFNELVKNEVIPPTDAAPMAPELVQPMKHTLADGTEIEVTEMSVGGIVTIQSVAAPVGDYTLEDGTVLTVGDNGAITALVPATDAAPMVEDMSAKFAAFETSTIEKFASYETKFAEYEAKLAKATKVIEGLLNLTQTLAETPTGTPDASIIQSNFKEEKGEKVKSYNVLFN